MASFNQIMDPWVYILFRKTLLTRIIQFIKVHLCLQRKQISSKVPGVGDIEEISRVRQGELSQQSYNNGAGEPFLSKSTGETLS